jgi:hypothetical protein
VLPDGATRLSPGFAISLDDVALEKVAVLDLSVAGHVAPAGMRLSLYASGADSVWRALGGTVDAAGTRISTPFTVAGRYALFAAPEGTAPISAGALRLTLTPRVLSSRGSLANASVRIGFALDRSGPVRVTVHNRAGRLVREVLDGQTLGPGTNLVSWDGRDQNQDQVEAGLYLVTVEALGQRHTQALGVVR